MTTNSSHSGGVVRQHGGLSFTRVYQSSHDVAWFQPQTTYEIFNRALFDKDIATGQVSTVGTCYSSIGPSSSWHIKDTLAAEFSKGICAIWVAPTSKCQ